MKCGCFCSFEYLFVQIHILEHYIWEFLSSRGMPENPRLRSRRLILSTIYKTAWHPGSDLGTTNRDLLAYNWSLSTWHSSPPHPLVPCAFYPCQRPLLSLQAPHRSGKDRRTELLGDSGGGADSSRSFSRFWVDSGSFSPGMWFHPQPEKWPMCSESAMEAEPLFAPGLPHAVTLSSAQGRRCVIWEMPCLCGALARGAEDGSKHQV